MLTIERLNEVLVLSPPMTITWCAGRDICIPFRQGQEAGMTRFLCGKGISHSRAVTILQFNIPPYWEHIPDNFYMKEAARGKSIASPIWRLFDVLGCAGEESVNERKNSEECCCRSQWLNSPTYYEASHHMTSIFYIRIVIYLNVALECMKLISLRIELPWCK